MAKIQRGGSFLSNEIRKNFSSFYLFGDLSTTKKDLVGKNDLTYAAGSPSLFYGKDFVGEKFDGTKYLVNTSISIPITNVPVFVYFNAKISESSGSTMRLLSMNSSSPPGYHIDVYRDAGGAARVYGQVTHSDLVPPNDISYTKNSKNNADYYSAGVFSLRSDALGTLKLFVNGEKQDINVYRAINIGAGGSINKISIGAGTTGANGFIGGIFSAGWGTGEPNDDFFIRLSKNPYETIFQKSFYRMRASVGSKQRRSFSSLGTRSGKRQAT